MPVATPLVEYRAADVLKPEQILAIGKIAAEWGMLEFALHAHGQNICRVFPGLAFGILTGKPDGRRMAEILQSLAPVYLPLDIVEDFQQILARVNQVGIERHEVVHGVWNLTPAILGAMKISAPPDTALNVVIKSAGKVFKQTRLSTGQLEDLAERIAIIRLDLNRLLHPLPFPVGRDFALAIELEAKGDLQMTATVAQARAASPRLDALNAQLGPAPQKKIKPTSRGLAR